MEGTIDPRKSAVVRRFVPKLVVSRFEKHKNNEGHAAGIKGTNGIVAYFDISGFSTLANKLEVFAKKNRFGKKKMSNRYSTTATYSSAALGTGAEQLAVRLNETLGTLVNEILESGGDIIKFAGDALIVVWNEEDNSILALSAVVADCALRCIDITLNAEGSLHLHTGIGSGKILLCHLGGKFDRWEFLIAGGANEEAAAAEAVSEKDQVVVSSSFYEEICRVKALGGVTMTSVNATPEQDFFRIESISLNHNVQGVTFPEKINLFDASQLPMQEQVLNLAKAYIPRPVMQLIEAETESVNELRKVTVIFFKLDKVVDEQPEPEEKDDSDEEKNKKVKFLKSIQAAVRAVQEAAYSQYGTLRQFIIDDKGCVAIVVIGLPPHYFEDNAARAVKVVANLICKSKVQASAGICTGTVFCGAIGSEYRAEYSVTGDCINLAARLMGKAEQNSVLCDEVTYNQAMTNPLINFTPVSSIMVKGYNEPVPVFRPDLNAIFKNTGKLRSIPSQRMIEHELSQDNALAVNAEFECIGQVEVKRHITDVLEPSVQTRCKAVLIEGEPGSGKSHMTQWAANVASKKVKHVLYSIADPSESITPFATWRNILMDILMLEKSDSIEGGTAKTSASKRPSLVSVPLSDKSTARGTKPRRTTHHAVQGSSQEMSGDRKNDSSGSGSQLSKKISNLVTRRSYSNASQNGAKATARNSLIDKKRASLDKNFASFDDMDQLSQSNYFRNGLDKIRKNSIKSRSGLSTPTSKENMFLRVSTHTGEQYIAEQSYIVKRLKFSQRLGRRNLHCLTHILPGVFSASPTQEKARDRAPSDQSESGVFSFFQNLTSKFEIPSSPSSSKTMFKRYSTNMGSDPTHSSIRERVDTLWQNTPGGNGVTIQTPNAFRKKPNHAASRIDLQDTMDVMIVLLEEVATDGPVLVIIDDAHHMDEYSWELLKKAVMARKLDVTREGPDTGTKLRVSGPNIRFIITYRKPQAPDVYNPHWEELLELCETDENKREDSADEGVGTEIQKLDKFCAQVALSPFGLRECAAFLNAQLNVGIGTELLKFLYQATNGNPGYLINLFKGLLEQQLVRIDHLTGMAQVMQELESMPSENVLLLSLPGHFVADVYKRFDKLGKNVQLIIKLASAIGKHVPIDILFFLYEKRSQFRDVVKSMYRGGVASDPEATNASTREALIEAATKPLDGSHEKKRKSHSRLSLFSRRSLSRKMSKNKKTSMPTPRLQLDELDSETSEELEVEFDEALQLLKRVNFITEQTSAAGEVGVIFKNDSERCVIYNMMLNAHKQKIHRHILEWHEERIPSGHTVNRFDTGMFGYHALLSGQNIKAFTYFDLGVEDSIKGMDCESVECFAFSCKEVIENNYLNEELQRVCEGEALPVYIVNYFRTKTYLMLAKWAIMTRQWDQSKDFLRAASRCGRMSEHRLQALPYYERAKVYFQLRGNPTPNRRLWTEEEIAKQTDKVTILETKKLLIQVDSLRKKIQKADDILNSIVNNV